MRVLYSHLKSFSSDELFYSSESILKFKKIFKIFFISNIIRLFKIIIHILSLYFIKAVLS